MQLSPINFNVSTKQNLVNLKQEKQAAQVTNSMDYASVPAACYAANAITFGNSKTALIHSKKIDPKQNFATVFGMEKFKGILLEMVNNVKNKKAGPSGAFLYGPPGCGKTTIINALAAETNLPLYNVNIWNMLASLPRKLTPDEQNALYHKDDPLYISERCSGVDFEALMNAEKEGRINVKEQTIVEYNKFTNIQRIFGQLAREYKDTGEPSILVFNDADYLFSEMNGLQREQIIKLLDNAKENGIVSVFTTNYEKSVDKSIKSHTSLINMEIAKPNYSERIEIIKGALNTPLTSYLVDDEGLIKRLADLSEDFSTAKIVDAIDKAVLKSVKLNGKQAIAAGDLIANMREANELTRGFRILFDKETITHKPPFEDLDRMLTASPGLLSPLDPAMPLRRHMGTIIPPKSNFDDFMKEMPDKFMITTHNILKGEKLDPPRFRDWRFSTIEKMDIKQIIVDLTINKIMSKGPKTADEALAILDNLIQNTSKANIKIFTPEFVQSVKDGILKEFSALEA